MWSATHLDRTESQPGSLTRACPMREASSLYLNGVLLRWQGRGSRSDFLTCWKDLVDSTYDWLSFFRHNVPKQVSLPIYKRASNYQIQWQVRVKRPFIYNNMTLIVTRFRYLEYCISVLVGDSRDPLQPLPLCQGLHRVRSKPHQSSTNTRANIFVDCPTFIAWPLRGHPSVAVLLTIRSYHVVLIRATTTPDLRGIDAENSVGLLAPACCDRHSRNSRPGSMGMERETRRR